MEPREVALLVLVVALSGPLIFYGGNAVVSSIRAIQGEAGQLSHDSSSKFGPPKCPTTRESCKKHCDNLALNLAKKVTVTHEGTEIPKVDVVVDTSPLATDGSLAHVSGYIRDPKKPVPPKLKAGADDVCECGFKVYCPSDDPCTDGKSICESNSPTSPYPWSAQGPWGCYYYVCSSKGTLPWEPSSWGLKHGSISGLLPVSPAQKPSPPLIAVKEATPVMPVMPPAMTGTTERCFTCTDATKCSVGDQTHSRGFPGPGWTLGCEPGPSSSPAAASCTDSKVDDKWLEEAWNANKFGKEGYEKLNEEGLAKILANCGVKVDLEKAYKIINALTKSTEFPSGADFIYTFKDFTAWWPDIVKQAR